MSTGELRIGKLYLFVFRQRVLLKILPSPEKNPGCSYIKVRSKIKFAFTVLNLQIFLFTFKKFFDCM